MIRMRHPRLYLVAAVLFVLFGYTTMRITLELVQGPSFAVTEGKVTYAAWHSSMSRTGRSYFVDISYDYVVDGRPSRGSAMSPMTCSAASIPRTSMSIRSTRKRNPGDSGIERKVK